MDVSVLISALAGGWFDHILQAIKDGKLTPIVSPALLDELQEVVSRDRMRKWFDQEDGLDFARALKRESSILQPTSETTACRDPDDNYLLSLAECSKANYLVTRDEDLLSLRRWRDTAIVHPARFLKILSGESWRIIFVMRQSHAAIFPERTRRGHATRATCSWADTLTSE